MTSSRRQFSLRTLFLTVAAASVVCALAAFALRFAAEQRSFWGGDHSGVNLTYEEFVARTDEAGFDPRGAREICYHLHSTRDGYDHWQKLTISSDDYEPLAERFSVQMAERKFMNRDQPVARSLEKTETVDPNFPASWPDADGVPPAWWSPPVGGSHLRCTRWDIQIDDGPYSGRAMGWYWLYDETAQTLWIWEWNYQHYHLK